MARPFRAPPAFKRIAETRRHMCSSRNGGPPVFTLGALLTVAGIWCMLLGLLLDSSVFVQLIYWIREPFHKVAHPFARFSSLSLFPMAHEQIAPPTKKELGNAGWTLIHSIAANYPEEPSSADQYHAKAFLRSIGKLYPCKRCRQHFEKYLTTTPPDLSTREQFMLWACGAHNEVNKRNGKAEFPCRMKKLEQRWGDCGCQGKKQSQRHSHRESHKESHKESQS